MQKQMRASDVCKANGLSSMSELCEMTGQSYGTLRNWYLTKRDLFDVVLIGAVFIKKTHEAQAQVDDATQTIANLNWGLQQQVKSLNDAKAQS